MWRVHEIESWKRRKPVDNVSDCEHFDDKMTQRRKCGLSWCLVRIGRGFCPHPLLRPSRDHNRTIFTFMLVKPVQRLSAMTISLLLTSRFVTYGWLPLASTEGYWSVDWTLKWSCHIRSVGYDQHAVSNWAQTRKQKDRDRSSLVCDQLLNDSQM